jgi:hypothetical protein
VYSIAIVPEQAAFASRNATVGVLYFKLTD